MKDKYLPIGTVVLLKDVKKEVMITGYAVLKKGEVIGKDDKGTDIVEPIMHDYSAVLYPEGLLATDVQYAFNHDKIEKIVYMGYETDKQKELSKSLLEIEKKIKLGVKKIKKNKGKKSKKKEESK